MRRAFEGPLPWRARGSPCARSVDNHRYTVTIIHCHCFDHICILNNKLLSLQERRAHKQGGQLFQARNCVLVETTPLLFSNA